jgi:hypothetical protein
MLHSRHERAQSVANTCSPEVINIATTTTIQVTIEGSSFALEDRDYKGSELRELAGLANKDKLVREEADGSETAIPPGKKVRPKEGDNFYVSVRFRRG